MTIAGTGVPGSAVTGGPPRRASWTIPPGVAVDAAGDLLIADTANCRLRLVAASNGTRFGVTVVRGHIYTVAGNGICGSAGDGGPATDAELWDPGALAVDAGGDVLIADQGNRTIRELAATTGTFYGVAIAADHLGTVAGEGSYGPYLIDGLSAAGRDGRAQLPDGHRPRRRGDLYIADGAMHAIRFVPAGHHHPARQAGTGRRHVHRRRCHGDRVRSATGPPGSRPGCSTRPGSPCPPRGSSIYADSQADVVRELPAGS